MPKIELPRYVRLVRKKGREYYYYHEARGTDRERPPVRLPDDPRLPEWWQAYRIAAGIEQPVRATDTIDSLTEAYCDQEQNSESRAWRASTRRQYERHCRTMRAFWGELSVQAVSLAGVRAARDRMGQTPCEANAFLRSVSAFLSWCEAGGHISDNPARRVRKLKTTGTWEPWSQGLICQAEMDLPWHIWAPCLLALYTGQREGDVLKMARNHIKDGEIRVVGEKDGKLRWIPVHPALAPVLHVKHSATTILVNARGRPWTADGFRASFRKAKTAAGWAERATFHGLRKNAVNSLFEVGCSTAEVAAITGQTLQMVEHYAQARDQRELARSGMARWAAEARR